jgi:hypothetical protein
LARKLEDLKLYLKKWNEEVFGNVEMRKKNFLVEVHDLDAIVELFLSDEKMTRKAKITRDLKMTTPLDEVSWRQKSRTLWLRDED